MQMKKSLTDTVLTYQLNFLRVYWSNFQSDDRPSTNYTISNWRY